MEDEKYKLLMKELGVENIKVEEFKKAFDITPHKNVRSYNNQRLASLGQSALRLIYSEILFEDNKFLYSFEELDSYEKRIDIFNVYNLGKYVFSSSDSMHIGFVIKSTLIEAIAGVIFVNLGYELLKKWCVNFVIKAKINNNKSVLCY